VRDPAYLAYPLREVSIDPKGIHRCLLNLVSNALDACKDRKGAAVNVSTANGNQEEVTIKVADQGCGMDEATLNSIFNPFFSRKESGGTGLGLSVSQKIIQEHNGRIEMDSELGRGTTFSVYLPKRKKRAVPI
jgi:signal transduction histidine kinase